MSLGHGASIVRDGLVFCYDQGNIQKSWKGVPATNLFTETNLNNWTKNSATTSTSQYVTPFDDAAYGITDSSTTGYSSIQRVVTVANDSTSYTISLMIRKTAGGISARLGFNATISGGTQVVSQPRFNSDTGVATSGTVVDFGEWWYWYFTITNNSTGNTSLSYSFYPATSTYNANDNVLGVGTAIIGSVMLVAGSVAARFVNGTRSTTQALLDLTKQNTINAVSLAYASDNTFSFDGTSSQLTTSSTAASLGISNDLTISIFTRRAASPTNALQGQAGFGSGGSISIKNSSNYIADINTANSTRYVINITTAGSMTSYENVWVNLCVTVSGTTAKTYLNGVLVNTQAMDTTIKSFASEVFGLGNGYGYFKMQGNLSIASVYNKALTEAEVKQNFEAIRGRYGI